MKKMLRNVVICLFIGFALWMTGVIRDRAILDDRLIRLHVIADSDSAADQAAKLAVRDAVNGYLVEALRDVTSVDEARAYLQEKLPVIREVANTALKELGVTEKAEVDLCREAFGIRDYDTFSLPSGVYEALKITIGSGEGKNWWCVVYPSLCVPAVSEDMESVAAGAGFPEELSGALTGDEEYEIRFFFLDLLGRLEKLLHRE